MAKARASDNPQPAKATNTGKPYEVAAEAFFRDKYGAQFTVTRDVKMPNRLEGDEQIDILLETSPHPDFRFRVAVEAKDYGRRLTKKDYRDIEGKFKDAGAERGIIVCASGLQAGAEKLRKASANPTIDLHVKTREQLIEGAWSDDFLDAIPRLKSAKTDAAPSPELIQKVVLAIETHPHYSRYFFHELENPAWLPILAKAGVLERALAGESQVNASVAGDYVGRFADSSPEAVVGLARKFRGPNSWVVEDLLKAAARLPSEERAAVVEAARGWDFSHVMYSAEVGEPMLMEARDGRLENALSLHAALTRLLPVEDEEGDLMRGRVKSLMGEHWLRDATVGLLPQIAALAAKGTLEYARRRLCEAVALEHPFYEGDLPTSECPHLGHEPEHGVRGYADPFLFAYRDALLRAAEVDPAAALAEAKEVLAVKDCGAVVRCALYAAAKRPEALYSLFDDVLADVALWHRDSYQPELETLVEECWASLDEPRRVAVVRRILGLGPFDYGYEPEAEKVERWRRITVAQWLCVVEPLGWPTDLAAEAASALSSLKAETGVTARESRVGPQAFFLDPRPDETGRFGEMSASEVLEYCRSFTTFDVGYHTKTPLGVAERLKEQVAARPVEFLAVAEEVIDLPFPCYHASIADGLADAGKKGRIDVPLAAATVATFAAASYPSVRETSRDREVGAPRWARQEYAHLVADLAEHGPWAITAGELDALLSLWSAVEAAERADPRTAPSDEIARYEYEASMNSSDGQLSIALVALAARSLRASQDKSVGQTERDAYSAVYARARDLLESYVLASPRPRIRGPIGLKFSEAFLIDRTWAEANVDRIFDRDDQDLWEAAWEAHLMYRTRFRPVFEFLAPQYERALSALPKDGKAPTWGEMLGRDMAIMWMDAKEGDGCELVCRFVAEAPLSCVGNAAFCIQNRLRKDADEATWRRAIAFWRLVAESRPDASGDALARMLFWLTDAPIFVKAGDVEALLVASFGAERHSVPPQAFRFLAERASQEPISVARVLRAACDLKETWMTHAAAEDMREAAKACYLSGNPEAMALALDVERAMLRRGVVAFEGVVTGLRRAGT